MLDGIAKQGAVLAYGSELTGIIDVGRYPHGAGELAEAIARALRESRFDSCARDDVMRKLGPPTD